MLLYSSSQEDCCSLSSLCDTLEDCFGVEIRKQSLDERFNESCLAFVKSVLVELLEEQLHLDVLYHGSFWKHFPRVRIKDSTRFKVPDLMKDQFKGNGGSAAALCIQYEYDLGTGRILDLHIQSAAINDRKDALETLGHLQTGDLVVRDLGYYSLEVFEWLIGNNIFFLSRLQAKTIVFEQKAGKYQEIDFKKLHQKMQKNGIEQMEIDVFLGMEYKLPVRMILRLVDEQVYDKRIRKREKRNRKVGCKMHQQTRIRYRFDIYVTNTCASELPAKEIFQAYRLRWQIELIFKYWKSLYKVHIGRIMRQTRYLCMLYAKLILVVINLQITRGLQRDIQKEGKDGYRLFFEQSKSIVHPQKTFLSYCGSIDREKK